MILLPLIWPLAWDSAVFNLMSRNRKYDLCVVSSGISAIMRCVASCTVDACKSAQASASASASSALLAFTRARMKIKKTTTNK